MSLTLTPMMCAKLLARVEVRPAALFGWTERGFDALFYVYEPGLAGALRHQPAILVVQHGDARR